MLGRCELAPAMSSPQTGPDACQRLTATVEIDRILIVRLRPEAAKRGMQVPALIRDLLDVIVADKLTTAILDDGP
jgi:hypothetical protein